MKTLHYSIFAILGIIFIFSNNVAFADSIKSTDSFLQKCNDTILPIPTLKPASVNSSSPKLGILVMQPNSVATVCIKYVKLSHGNSSFETNNTQLIPSVEIENIQVQGRQTSFGYIPVNNVVAKASQKIISFGSQKNASTVILYTLSTKPDSVGYYHVGIPYMCGNILLAVGYSVSQIDSSAFQDVISMCFNYGVETSLVGIQGANMTYVDISNKTIHSTKLPENISIIPPLQQMRISDDARFIQCNPDLQLVFKSENGSPACVKPDTASKLVERGYAKETVSIPNQTSNVKSTAQNYTNVASDIIPGHMRRGTCGGPAPAIQSSSKIINATGFVGVYHDTMRYYANPDDYVLEPGHTGIITYEVDAGPAPKSVSYSPIRVPKNFNVTNYAIFYHEITSLEELAKHPGVTIHDHYDYNVCFTRPTDGLSCSGEIFGGKTSIEAYVTDHVGVNAAFNPAFEALQFNDTHSGKSSQIIQMSISSDANAARGTYMVILSPEECRGGEIFLLTIGEQSYHE